MVSSSKIGSFEKSCVTQCLAVAIPLIVAQLKAGKFYQTLPVLVMVFNKKKTFYKDLRTSAMIGSYWNKVPGAPEVRAQCIAAFCELQGFSLLLSTLEHMMTTITTSPTGRSPSDAEAPAAGAPVPTASPPSGANVVVVDDLDVVMESEDLRILLQALLEFRASVADTVCTKVCVLIMTYFTKVADSVLKKEASDAVGAVLAIIRRLVDAGAVAAAAINHLWLELTQRYVESTSLPLRLFGLEQINLIVSSARAARAFPPRYLVRNAGTPVVNGVYVLKPDATSATYVYQREGSDQVFTLFCCTMKSGSKWWFISEADKMQPGSDQDIDYYQHQSQYEEYLPPTHSWVPTGKGVAPAPELIPESVHETGDDVDETRLDHILCAWVARQKVVEEVFGDRIHREIVSRSALLIKFLAETNKLSAHYLDVIWQSCIQKDQTLVTEIHSLLIATVPYLTNELLLHLVESIHASLHANLRRNEPFPELMSFLQRLAASSPSFLMDRSAGVTTAILQLLWSIQMHCSIANVRLSRSLRDFFQEGLRSEYGEPLRKVFLSECVEGIKRSCFLPVGQAADPPNSTGSGSGAADRDAVASKALELLKFLIDSYRIDQTVVVEALDAEHGLVSLLFDELAAFVARCSEKQAASYRTSIGHRLELIHYIHVKSPTLELTIPQIDRLWSVLSSSPAEREFCLIFFNQTGVRGQAQPPQLPQQVSHQSIGANGASAISTAFSADVCLHIFNDLLCQQTDFKTLGCLGYKCFHTYFVGLNAQQQQLHVSAALKETDEDDKDKGTDNDTDTDRLNVLGIDALWRIAFEAPLDVSELATRELLRVYERSSDDLSGSDASMDSSVKDFLHRVFQKLADVRDSSPESLKLVRQCTNLLSGVVTNPRKKPQPFVAHGMAGRGACFNVKVLAQRIPTSAAAASAAGGSPSGSQETAIRAAQVVVYANQTLWLFRKQLEKAVGHPLQQTKILLSGSAVSGDHKTLAELHISETTELRVLLFNSIVQRSSLSASTEADHPMTLSAEPSAAALHHPGAVIARDGSYFEILFRILDTVAGHAVHTSLWNFLKKIPTATELLDRVAHIGLHDSWDTDGVSMGSPSTSSTTLPDANRNGNADWSSLLNTASHHRAVYTLQIMDALLLPADNAKITFARTYLRRFIHGGGFHEVLSYFVQANFHTSSFNEGAAVALRILKFCLFDSGHSDQYFSFAGVEDEADDETDDVAVVASSSSSPPPAPVALTPKIVIEQTSYDNLVQKISELIVSEHHRSTAAADKAVASDAKATPRILIDAIKTVESIVTIANEAADKYMASPDLCALISTILMQNESDQVREQWLSSLQSVCKASTHAAGLVFESLIESIGRVESVSTSCDQYTRMLRFLAQSGDGASLLCKALAQTVLGKLRAGFSNKFLACNERSVEVVIGFLEFLRDTLVFNVETREELARDVVDVVYEECLFTLPSVDRQRVPLCVSLETRRPAFKLLATAISSNASILQDLQARLSRLFTRSDTLQYKWGQESNMETRGIGEHVGLKNQGSSCYMNSFLQQLFMHPTLRQGLMDAKVAPRPQPREPTKSEVEKSPERLVGFRVAVECVGGRVYEANVVGFDELSGRHTLRYDDDGEASFVLAEGRPGNENGRYAILQSELTGAEATLEVLRQVQRTFCYLRDSEMRYFNPKALVESCKCLNLEFSVYQQNDATEFCDKLLDRLETGLKTTPQGVQCLQTALSGKLISQKLPKGCGHRYEREEPFIRLELQIRGKESIEESLAGFVEGEVMDGDNKVECELCATKKAAVRRTCFGVLPNLLILHLKRFDLDYTTFETVKLNNRCSFPMNLNMKPYTKAGIEELEASTDAPDDTSSSSSAADEDATSEADSTTSDDFMGDANERDVATAGSPSSPIGRESSISTTSSVVAVGGRDSGGDDDDNEQLDPNFEYRLKGILVHSGVAQGGHYYSFIYDHVSEKWFKYDDEDVSPFDPANIETECFGGVQRRSWHGSNAMEMEVFSNALMLFYEKVVPVADDVATKKSGDTGDNDDDDSAMTDVSSAEDEEDEADARCEYEAEVWKANEVFLQNSYLFDVEFHEFLREMVQSKYIKDAPPPVDTALSIPSAPETESSELSVSAPAPVALSFADSRSDELIHTTLTDVGVEFVLSVLLHSREKHGIARWIAVLAAKFARHKQICVRFFDALATTRRTQWLRGLVFECPDSIARQSFAHLVTRALTAYETHLSVVGTDNSDVVVIRRVVESLAEFLDQTSVMQQSHLEECFMLIRNCAELSTTARTLLQRSDMIARLVNFFLSDRAPAAIKDAFPSSHLPPVTNRYASPDYQYLLEAIIAILGLPRRTTEPLLAETTTGQSPHRVALSEKTEAALKEIFADYAVDGSLGLDELTKYLRTSVNTVAAGASLEQNAQALLHKYGNNDVPQRVEVDAFLTYYTDIAAGSTKSVLQDLRAFGFGDDLKRQPRNLPLASTLLDGLSPLSREALLNDVFMDSALEEDAETVGDLLLRLSIGDRATSAMLLRSLLHCMNSTETGWKGQPVVDVCALLIQHLLSYEFAFQHELIEMALVHPEFGLVATAANREKIRLRYVNNNHVPLFVYRQISALLELESKIPAVKAWLATHRTEWEWMYEWLRLESLKPSLGGRLAVLFREPAKLDTLLRLGDALGVPYCDEERSYLVEGAGFDDVNGVYKSTAHTHDNCPTYAYVSPTSGVEYTLFRCSMPSKARRWYISYSPNKNLLGTMSDEDYYFIQCQVDTEAPPEDGWKVWSKNDKSRPGPPTVRLYHSTVGGMAAPAVVAASGDDDEFGDADADSAADVDADADTVEYDDSEDEIRVSNERFQAVHLDNQEDGSSGADDFM